MKQDLKEKPVNKEIRYYFSLSTASTDNHSTTITYLNQHIDESLEKQIQLLVLQGISNVNYIRHHLKDFVALKYLDVEFTSSAFYPSEQIVYNYILKYVNEKQKGLIDQEKVAKVVKD